MLDYLNKIARDDGLVKVIFDNVRNLGLCALVLAAATWKQKHFGSGYVAIWDYFVATMLAFAGLLLMMINNENLLYKVRSTTAARWLKALFGFAYILVATELLRFLQTGRSGV